MNKKPAKKIPLGWKKSKGKYVYYFKPGIIKRYNSKKMVFLGFKDRPTGLGLYNTGGGFNQWQSNKIGGDFLLRYLKDKYKKEVRIALYAKKTNGAIKENKKHITIKVSLESFIKILTNLGTEINKNKGQLIQKRLENYFPINFKKDAKTEQNINSKLTDINLNKLDKADHDSISAFIKKYLGTESNTETFRKLQVDLVIQGQRKTLDQVIKKFKKHLSNKKFDEKRWQKFLHNEVFFFMSNYVESIREANVNFGKTDEGEKKPDFVWIDLYGFLDVFEIKTPFTNILAERIDKSHRNYYFSKDASMAVSQIEKYILFLEKNVEGFQKYLQKQTSIPFSVLKPKAFLIIGNSKEFEKNDQKKKDFRLLRRLFKNIEFITFDELLDNLKSLASKFEKNTTPKKV
jgi:Domain of unknown function (DUF4263)